MVGVRFVQLAKCAARLVKRAYRHARFLFSNFMESLQFEDKKE